MPVYTNNVRHDNPHYRPLTVPLNNNQAGNGGTTGFGNGGDCSMSAQSPYYKGYEGHYWPNSTRSTATFSSTLSGATPSTPYDYGQYNKCPRSVRGGLGDGWANQAGNIFKIVKTGTSTTWSNGIYIFSHPRFTHFKHAMTRFRAYIFIETGPTELQIGIMDAQSTFSVGAFREWKYIDHILGTSDVMEPNFLLSLGPTSQGQTREVWMAFPTIEAIARSNMDDDEGTGHAAQFIGVRST
jgi:hypothetical protein